MSAVKDAVFGGKPKQGKAFARMSADEQARLNQIEAGIQSLYDQTNLTEAQSGAQDITQLFQSHLKDFLGGGANSAFAKQSADYVDELFTNPAQNIVNQNLADAQSQAAGRAAALGRNPNADIATQQALLGETQRQNLGLQAERGARIQNASLDRLNTGLQGAGYLNNLAQQAFGNQLNLLNARTGLAGIYQNNRANTGAVSTSPGILGSVANAAGQIGGTIGAITGVGSGVSRMFGSSGGSPQGGSYLSSQSGYVPGGIGRFTL